MTAPNIKSPTTVTGKSAITKITGTTATSILANASASGKALKINSVFAANISANDNVYIDLYITRNSTNYYLAYQVVIPYSATQILVRKDTYIYLEEGDTLYFKSAVVNAVDVCVSYEDIS